MYKHSLLAGLLILLQAVTLARADDTASTNLTVDEKSINHVLDQFHDAAAHGDKDRYLGLMTKDGVFLGTDEWERWPKEPTFTEYVEGRFQNGRGWSYESVERNVMLSDDGTMAWFDEVTFSETSGRFRGTGVLIKDNNEWKIAHYAMSFLIFNENWSKVIELNKQVAETK